MSRPYFLEDPIHPNGGIEINCVYDEDCLFCDHCTNFFWDYTNGPYMIFCDEDHDTSIRPCKYFKEGRKNEQE